MLHLTRKTDYALVALARLAEQASVGGQPLSARRIADQYGLPLPLLGNILKCLHRHELINSTRGARGGYFLSEAPERVTVARVVAALEGPVRLTPCCDETDESDLCLSCRAARLDCPVARKVRQLNDQIHDLLNAVTVRSLIAPPAQMAGSEPGGLIPSEADHD